MTRYLLEVQCPACGNSYDFWIPGELTARQALEAVMERIREHEGNPALFGDGEGVQLLRRDGTALHDETTLRRNDVRSGDTLVLL